MGLQYKVGKIEKRKANCYPYNSSILSLGHITVGYLLLDILLS